MSAKITLAHGNGGVLTRTLIADVFARQLANPILDVARDAAILSLDGEWAVTSDGFSVLPLEFPGGSIGTLTVYGTVNDLAVSGARAHFMTLNVLIEEGLVISDLERLVMDLARAARACEVAVITGDTKVIPRTGTIPTLYFSSTGLGRRVSGPLLGMNQIRDGDAILVSGNIGEHGTAVLLSRGEFGVSGDVRSDCGSVWPIAERLLGFTELRFMRDPTRGGLATVLHEIAGATGLGIRVSEAAVPVNPSVRAVCELLGYDPMYLACEGRVVAVTAATRARTVLRAMQESEGGRHAALIGYIDGAAAGVVVETAVGGARYLDELRDDPLPRIC